MSELITTKYGKAKVNSKGYYHIISKKENNFGKKLHRLIYEDYYKISLLPSTDIHHKDGNKLNNSIDNLEAISHGEHSKLHTSGKNNPMYGTNDSLETMFLKSSVRSKSGYFRVSIFKNDKMRQGFYYGYQYYDENNKRRTISSVDLNKLKEKVIEKNLPWKKFREHYGD